MRSQKCKNKIYSKDRITTVPRKSSYLPIGEPAIRSPDEAFGAGQTPVAATSAKPTTCQTLEAAKMFPNRERKYEALWMEKPALTRFCAHELIRKVLPYQYGI
jgi:hypothetical protein